jgi:hypothetical protein
VILVENKPFVPPFVVSIIKAHKREGKIRKEDSKLRRTSFEKDTSFHVPIACIRTNLLTPDDTEYCQA